MVLLVISFVAGVLTVLAPCVLPLLPVIVGGSMEGGSASRKRAFIIIASLGVSLILFTLLLKASTVLIGVPEMFWKWVSGLIIIVFGATLLVPSLWERFSFVGRVNRGGNRLLAVGFRRGGFWGDVVMGAALGPVFSACSPTYFVLLASVLPVSFALGVAYLGVFVFGLCLALLLVALLGQRLADRLGWAADPRGFFKRALGALFILVGIAVITGVDKKFQIWVLDTGFLDVTRIEQKLLEMQ